MTTFDGVQPTNEEKHAQIMKLVEDILSRKPFSIVIYAEFEKGVVSGAVGSPLTLVNLMDLGRSQIEDLMRRQGAAGENG